MDGLSTSRDEGPRWSTRHRRHAAATLASDPPPPSSPSQTVRPHHGAQVTQRALITGITGQDGSYLTELLLGKGYEVHGLVRRSSTINRGRIDHIDSPDLHLHYGDLTDGVSLVNLIREIEPHEVYNLGAQSHVKVSFEMP